MKRYGAISRTNNDVKNTESQRFVSRVCKFSKKKNQKKVMYVITDMRKYKDKAHSLMEKHQLIVALRWMTCPRHLRPLVSQGEGFLGSKAFVMTSQDEVLPG